VLEARQLHTIAELFTTRYSSSRNRLLERRVLINTTPFSPISLDKHTCLFLFIRDLNPRALDRFNRVRISCIDSVIRVSFARESRVNETSRITPVDYPSNGLSKFYQLLAV